MATVDKNFRVKNGLNVAGVATFDDNVVLGSAPLRYNQSTTRLQIQIDGIWTDLAFTSDIQVAEISLADLSLAIDYDGNPTYIVQGNGISISGESKYADAGSPSTSIYQMIFDPGVIAV